MPTGVVWLMIIICQVYQKLNNCHSYIPLEKLNIRGPNRKLLFKRQNNVSLPLANVKSNVVRCAIWYHLYNLKNVKNTHGGVLILVKLEAPACNFTKINTPPWGFFTFFKLYKSYQIAQRITNFQKLRTLPCYLFFHFFMWYLDLDYSSKVLA